MSALEGISVPVGTILAGKYRVEEVLGVGGMGVVAAARHLTLGEVFAIKFMRPSALEEGDSMERFLREARASARLRGEHVAKVTDVGTLDDGSPYMVMEYLSGVDLRRLSKQRGALPAADVVEYVSQACEAIAEAHALGIIHRDVKPANLFLTRRPNGSPCVKVLDFGVAKDLGADKALDVTKTADMLGSPLYMSPEQMRSGKSADPRSDIWALGVVLYELVSGAVPFGGRTVTEVCAQVFTERPKPLEGRIPGVSAALERVILRCLEKEPQNRFQTATDLAAALRSLDREDRAHLERSGPVSAGAVVGSGLGATGSSPGGSGAMASSSGGSGAMASSSGGSGAMASSSSGSGAMASSSGGLGAMTSSAGGPASTTSAGGPLSVTAPPSSGAPEGAASWGTTAAPVRTPSPTIRLGVGAVVGGILGAVAVAAIFLARGEAKTPANAPSSSAIAEQIPTIAPSTAPSVIAASTALAAASAEASSHAASASASAASAAKPAPAPSAKVKPAGKRPAVIDYGDRQ